MGKYETQRAPADVEETDHDSGNVDDSYYGNADNDSRRHSFKRAETEHCT